MFSLFRYAERILQNATDAEEVVQDVFLRAHKALTRQYDEARCRELALRAWLFRIARNLAFNKNRSLMPKLEVPLDDASDQRRWHLRGLASTSGAAADIERRQEMAQLDRAIAALPPEYRELIILRHSQDLSYEEIVEVTGLPLGTVKNRLFRAREMMRQQFVEKGITGI